MLSIARNSQWLLGFAVSLGVAGLAQPAQAVGCPPGGGVYRNAGSTRTVIATPFRQAAVHTVRTSQISQVVTSPHQAVMASPSPPAAVAPVPPTPPLSNTHTPPTVSKVDESPAPPVPQVAPEVKEASTDATPVDVAVLLPNEELEVDVLFAQTERGSIFLQIGELRSSLEITQWSAEAVRFRMPNLDVVKPIPIQISIYRPDGFLVREFPAILRGNTFVRLVSSNAEAE